MDPGLAALLGMSTSISYVLYTRHLVNYIVSISRMRFREGEHVGGEMLTDSIRDGSPATRLYRCRFFLGRALTPPRGGTPLVVFPMLLEGVLKEFLQLERRRLALPH
jgi:hypothetical protein